MLFGYMDPFRAGLLDLEVYFRADDCNVSKAFMRTMSS